MNAQFPPPREANRFDNNPPLPERIVIDFDTGLAEREADVVKLLDAIEAKAAAFGPCANDADVGAFGETIKTCSLIIKEVDAEREIHNRPLLDAQRALKGRADGINDRAKALSLRLRTTMDAYLAKKEAERVAEERRLAAIAAAAEAERQRAIKAAEDEARRVAEIERQRLQAIADAEAAKERARLQAIEDERAAVEQREAAAVKVEAVKVEVAPEPVYVPEPEPVFVTPVAERAPIRGDYGTSVSVVTTWHAKIVNMRQLPDHILKHPAVVEAAQKLVQAQVRAKNGIREMKGVEITSTTGSSVR